MFLTPSCVFDSFPDVHLSCSIFPSFLSRFPVPARDMFKAENWTSCVFLFTNGFLLTIKTRMLECCLTKSLVRRVVDCCSSPIVISSLTYLLMKWLLKVYCFCFRGARVRLTAPLSQGIWILLKVVLNTKSNNGISSVSAPQHRWGKSDKVKWSWPWGARRRRPQRARKR